MSLLESSFIVSKVYLLSIALQVVVGKIHFHYLFYEIFILMHTITKVGN